MADTFRLEVATPDRQFVDEQVNWAEVPGKDGYIGILAGHAALLSALGAGVLTYSSGSGQRVLAVAGGFLEILNNDVRVLADYAEFGQDVDTSAARHELEEAENNLKSAHETADTETALRAVGKARARLEAAERASGRTAA